MQTLDPMPDLLNQNLQLITSWCFINTLKFGKRWVGHGLSFWADHWNHLEVVFFLNFSCSGHIPQANEMRTHGLGPGISISKSSQ